MPAPEIKDEAEYIAHRITELIIAHGKEHASDYRQIVEGMCISMLALSRLTIAADCPLVSWRPLMTAAEDYIVESNELTALQELMNAPTEKVH